MKIPEKILKFKEHLGTQPTAGEMQPSAHIRLLHQKIQAGDTTVSAHLAVWLTHVMSQKMEDFVIFQLRCQDAVSQKPEI